jgi:hypothetical protein
VRIKSFDHSPLAALPEYHAVRQAVDALGRCLDDDDRGFSREDFIEAVCDVAATSYAGDICAPCWEMAWPHSGEVKGRQLWGRYRCSKCGRYWSRGYTTDLSLLAGI